MSELPILYNYELHGFRSPDSDGEQDWPNTVEFFLSSLLILRSLINED